MTIQSKKLESALRQSYDAVRDRTHVLVADLEPEDMVIQTMDDVSPTKWHLAHTSWFFETFILSEFHSGYAVYDERYGYLFNSYYNQVGSMHQRPHRGLLSRPTVREVMSYRQHVDQHMGELIESLEGHPNEQQIQSLIELGLNHEQQHQELLLTDIKHVLFQNPLMPAAIRGRIDTLSGRDGSKLEFVPFKGGIKRHGYQGSGFCFDNELPEHQVLLRDFGLANRPVTNQEYLHFIEDDGYSRAELWLSEGWAWVSSNKRVRPQYWIHGANDEFSLLGLITREPHAPVSHLSYYEADAYARWAGARLPTEFEWEQAAAEHVVSGNFVDSEHYHPVAAENGDDLLQLYGDVWEWTSSPYSAYPGYQPAAGAIGEYNGKFMCSQMVLRGGSCASSASHLRSTYRNFFYPDACWQFTGVRLARDI